MKKLPKISTPPFQVPEAYFGNLEQSILKQTVWGEQPAKHGLTWSPKLAWILASASLLVAVVWFLWPSVSTDNTQVLLADISDEEIYEYLYETGMSDTELLELASGDEDLIQDMGTLPELELEEQEMHLLMDELEWNADNLKKTNG